MITNSKTANFIKWLENTLGDDWKIVVGWAVILVVAAVSITAYIAIPKIRYAHASAADKCQIMLKKLSDSDKFCDPVNVIQSNKALVEVTRRASLTTQQKCHEDHKNFTDPDGGNAFIVLCHEDGTYEVKSADELQSQYESDMTDYYNSLMDN